MGPRELTRQEVLELLGRAAEQAQHAEAYHAAAANPGALQGAAAHQAARDAAAMQLIELTGCAEGFTQGRGDPGTTLARFDDALRPIVRTRMVYAHPETGADLPPLTPDRLARMIKQLKTSIANLDQETLRVEPPAQLRALKTIAAGIDQIEKDGFPNSALLRRRDLHYAGYFHEIQFGRLAKASGLYGNFGKSSDARLVDVNSSIYDADDMAHKFHTLRSGRDRSVLPVSVVAPEHRHRVPGRKLSELMRELRFEYQTPSERLEELQAAARAQAHRGYRDAVQGLADAYAEITGDPKAAALIRDYVQRKEPRLLQDEVEAIAKALRMAVAQDGAYGALPEVLRNSCLDLCFALDEQGDRRLIGIIDAAEKLAADAAAQSASTEASVELQDEPTRTRRRKRGRSL